MNQANIGIAVVCVFIILSILIFSPEDIEKKNMERDDEIVKASTTYCIYKQNIEKANAEIDNCLKSFEYKNANDFKNLTNTCRKIAYEKNMIDYYSDDEQTKINSSYINTFESSEKKANLQLSNKTFYKSKCA